MEVGLDDPLQSLPTWPILIHARDISSYIHMYVYLCTHLCKCAWPCMHVCPWMRVCVCVPVCVWNNLKMTVLHKHLDWFSNGRIQPKTQSTFPAMCSSLYLSAFPSRMNNWKHSVSTPDHKRSRMLLNYHTFHKGEKAVCCSVSQIRLKRSNSVSSSHTQTIYTCTIQLCWSILINLRKSRIRFKIPFSGKIRDVGMSYHICCSWCVQWKELKIVLKTLLNFSYIVTWI